MGWSPYLYICMCVYVILVMNYVFHNAGYKDSTLFICSYKHAKIHTHSPQNRRAWKFLYKFCILQPASGAKYENEMEISEVCVCSSRHVSLFYRQVKRGVDWWSLIESDSTMTIDLKLSLLRSGQNKSPFPEGTCIFDAISLQKHFYFIVISC